MKGAAIQSTPLTPMKGFLLVRYLLGFNSAKGACINVNVCTMHAAG